MKREYILICHIASCFFILLSKNVYTREETGYEYSNGCVHLQCESGSRCIKRRFWCKNPPCPAMLYCSKSRKESLKGPGTCDTVRCNTGHRCVVKVRGCHWDEECRQQIARCISEKEYYEGEASCAGFECPLGKRCILRESYCIDPPCKLIKSCVEPKDARIWFDKCRTLGCTSEYECFLRKPDDSCSDSSCAHTPDCTFTTENELISEHCRGWICPRMQKCVVRIVGSCKGYNCAIKRSCYKSSFGSLISTLSIDTADEITGETTTEKIPVQIESEPPRQELKSGRRMNINYPMWKKEPTTASTRKQSTRYVTFRKYEAEIPSLRQQIITTESTAIPGSLELTSNGPRSTLSYPPPRLNHDRLSTINTIGNELETTTDENNKTPTVSIKSKNSSFPTSLHAGGKTKLSSPRDAKVLELLKKIYVDLHNDALPLPAVLEGINFVGQGYPIWMKDEPGRSIPLGVKDKNDDGWGYYVPREPYRILLPPYEPVILIEDTKRRQFLPFLVYPFDYSFNEATLISSPEIRTRVTTGNPKADNIPTIVSDKIDSGVNSSTTVARENVNYFDDSSGDYANFPAMERTNVVLSNVRGDKELDNHHEDNEWQPWHVIHDYLEKNVPLADKQGFRSNVVEPASVYSHGNDASADTKTFLRNQIMGENEGRILETRHAQRYNKNLATSDSPRAPPISTTKGDYGSRNDELYDFANYPYDAIIDRDIIDKSRRGYQELSLDEIQDISPGNEENRQPSRAASTKLSFDERRRRRNEDP